MSLEITGWLILGVIILCFYKAHRDIKKCRATDSWVSTKAVVQLSNRLEVGRTFRKTGTEINYGYEVDGNHFIGNQIFHGIGRDDLITSIWFNSKKFVERSAQDGQLIDVFYNPDNPSQSCMRKGGEIFVIADCVISGLIYSTIFLVLSLLALLFT